VPSHITALRARLLALTASGDRLMAERMSRLIEPGPHAVSILITDFRLAQPLPSPVYFSLIQAAIAEIDDVIVRAPGIAAGHAAGRVTALFLAEDLGSPSRAARTAISAARRMTARVRDVASEALAARGQQRAYTWNVSLHWADAVYLGQVNTKSRQEITALGARLDECAWIQQYARGGEILASRALVDQLSAHDATRLALRPEHLVFRELGTPPPDAMPSGEEGIPISAADLGMQRD
jgi:class 3 adenylate cyclase